MTSSVWHTHASYMRPERSAAPILRRCACQTCAPALCKVVTRATGTWHAIQVGSIKRGVSMPHCGALYGSVPLHWTCCVRGPCWMSCVLQPLPAYRTSYMAPLTFSTTPVGPIVRRQAKTRQSQAAHPQACTASTPRSRKRSIIVGLSGAPPTMMRFRGCSLRPSWRQCSSRPENTVGTAAEMVAWCLTMQRWMLLPSRSAPAQAALAWLGAVQGCHLEGTREVSARAASAPTCICLVGPWALIISHDAPSSSSCTPAPCAELPGPPFSGARTARQHNSTSAQAGATSSPPRRAAGEPSAHQ